MNVLDLFCGAGGMSIGFEKAGFNVIGGVDKNKKALETFKNNHSGVFTLEYDIRNEIPDKILNLQCI